MGNSKGTVEWWTPGIGTPAVKLFVGGGVTDIGFHKGYMYTAAENVKVWDSRMLKVLHTYPINRKLTSLEISQSGLLTLNYGFKLDIYK
jgi:U3 small nucleolar RNA-associated protein 7